MKKFAIIVLLSLSFNSLFSQKYKAIAIAPSYLNILYVGVDNPVDIVVEGVNDDDLKVSVTNATIKKVRRGKFIIIPKEKGTGKITLSSKGKTLGSKGFRYQLLPDPKACILKGNSLKDGNIKKTHLLSIGGIRAEVTGYIDAKFEITSFVVTTLKGDSDYSAKSNSNRFSGGQKELIKGAPLGSKIIIEGIKCVGPDGVQRSLKDIILTIR